MNNNKPKTGPLKEELNQLLEGDSLSSDELNGILAKQNAALQSVEEKTAALEPGSLESNSLESKELNNRLSNNSLSKRYYLSAACALFAIVTFSAVTTLYLNPSATTQNIANINQGTNNSPKGIANKIAEEVALNHLTLKPLDKESPIVAELQNYFTQLEFSPFESKHALTLAALSGKHLLGGRYCSIQGVTALQLRYANTYSSNITLSESSKGAATLYQVNYESSIHGAIPNIENNEAPIQINQRGLNIQIWLEKGLLMALVGEVTE